MLFEDQLQNLFLLLVKKKKKEKEKKRKNSNSKFSILHFNYIGMLFEFCVKIGEKLYAQ